MKDYLKKTKFELWEVIAITLFSSLVMSFCTGYLVYRSSCGKVTSVNGDEYLAELYKYNNDELILFLVETGSHSELFNK